MVVTVKAIREWDDYLSGRYVCLRSVTPANMQRKNELCAAIAAELDDPVPDDDAWLERTHALVDELDALVVFRATLVPVRHRTAATGAAGRRTRPTT